MPGARVRSLPITSEVQGGNEGRIGAYYRINTTEWHPPVPLFFFVAISPSIGF
jgi:hypothetical protein